MSSRESVLKAAYKAPCSGQTSRLYQKRRFVTINKCPKGQEWIIIWSESERRCA